MNLKIHMHVYICELKKNYTMNILLFNLFHFKQIMGIFKYL